MSACQQVLKSVHPHHTSSVAALLSLRSSLLMAMAAIVVSCPVSDLTCSGRRLQYLYLHTNGQRGNACGAGCWRWQMWQLAALAVFSILAAPQPARHVEVVQA